MRLSKNKHLAVAGGLAIAALALPAALVGGPEGANANRATAKADAATLNFRVDGLMRINGAL